MGTLSTNRQRKGDYVVHRVKSSKKRPDKGWNWRYTVMLVGWFVIMFAIIGLSAVIALPVIRIVGIFLACAAIPMIIPFGKVRKKWDIHFSEWLGFSLLGSGPFVALVLFGINSVPLVDPGPERFKVVAMERDEYSVTYSLEDAYLADCSRFTTFRFINYRFALPKVKEVEVNRYTGLLGIEVIRYAEPVQETDLEFLLR